MSNDWLSKALDIPSPDMSEEDVKLARKALDSGRGFMLSKEKETGPFYLYMMGCSYEDVSEKTGWSRDIIIFTALHEHWHAKKLALELSDDKESVRHVLKQTMSSLLVATAHSIMQQSKDVISGKMLASDSKLIPSNMKDLEKFVMIMDKIYELSAKFENNQPNINVNIANVQPNAQPSMVTDIAHQALPGDRMGKFKLLKESSED